MTEKEKTKKGACELCSAPSIATLSLDAFMTFGYQGVAYMHTEELGEVYQLVLCARCAELPDITRTALVRASVAAKGEEVPT